MALSMVKPAKRQHSDIEKDGTDYIILIIDSMATQVESTKKSGESFGPKTVATLNKVLSTIATNLELGLNEDRFITDCFKEGKPALPPIPAIDEFCTRIEKARADFSKIASEFSDSELEDNVKSSLFESFNEIRSEITT